MKVGQQNTREYVNKCTVSPDFDLYALLEISPEIHLNFFPELFGLDKDLKSLFHSLKQLGSSATKKIILQSNSSLLLIAIPFIISLKDRIFVQLWLDCETALLNSDSIMRNIHANKRLKDLLDTARVLQSHQISISFVQGKSK